MLNWLALCLLIALTIVSKPIRTIPKGHIGVRKFLGKVTGVCRPGRTVVLPFVEELELVDSRKTTTRFSFTSGSEKSTFEATITFHIVDPEKALSNLPILEKETLPSAVTSAVSELSPLLSNGNLALTAGHSIVKIRRSIQQKILPIGIAVDRLAITKS